MGRHAGCLPASAALQSDVVFEGDELGMQKLRACVRSLELAPGMPVVQDKASDTDMGADYCVFECCSCCILAGAGRAIQPRGWHADAHHEAPPRCHPVALRAPGGGPH